MAGTSACDSEKYWKIAVGDDDDDVDDEGGKDDMKRLDVDDGDVFCQSLQSTLHGNTVR